MIPRGLTILGLAAVSWAVVIGIGWAVSIEVSHAPAMPAAQVYAQFNDASHFPTIDNRCNNGLCDLTGLGGIINWWDRWLDTAVLLKSNFRVVGVCASACEREYVRATQEYHLNVSVEPGARLIQHDV